MNAARSNGAGSCASIFADLGAAAAWLVRSLTGGGGGRGLRFGRFPLRRAVVPLLERHCARPLDDGLECRVGGRRRRSRRFRARRFHAFLRGRGDGFARARFRRRCGGGRRGARRWRGRRRRGRRRGRRRRCGARRGRRGRCGGRRGR